MRKLFIVLFLVTYCFGLAKNTLAQNAPAVHIYFEPATYVPSFYNGRPEASVGSTVFAKAIVSGLQDPKAYYYRWNSGNKTLSGGIVVGKDTVAIPLDFSDEMIVTVEVYDSNLNMITSGSEYLELSDPTLIFYEDNPLRGTNPLALTDTYTMTGSELRLRAEPYFMNRNILENNPRLEWSLDQQVTKNLSKDPLTLILEAPKGVSGRTLVGFYLHNTQNLLQRVRDQVMITF